mgnify:CR=1 FL=1|jgi:hypothetical protein|tara:strand:+ start:193 stop:588 length:396 start_codon:yes stop_codon:yes gene_type:complete
MVKCNKNDSESQCRSFKIIGCGVGFKSKQTSYYKGKTPAVAVRKFGRMLFKLINDPNSEFYKFKDQQTIKVIIKETTRGSDRKTYYFLTQRVELEKPVTRTLPNGQTVVNRYKVLCKRCPEVESIITGQTE